MPTPTGEPVYLDYMAATPCLPEVVEAMLPYFTEQFHNPQSYHPAGEEALATVEQAREQVARLIGASPQEIVFTSGASESNNWALKAIAHHPQRRGQHLVTSRIEHFSILNPCQTLERQGFAVTYLPVDQFGAIGPEVLGKAIRPDTGLVSVTHASNELGTLEPVAALAHVCRTAGVTLHIDAANTAGFLPLNVHELGVDILTLSPHLFYGPKGIGALYIRRGLRLSSLIEGGTQEESHRAGIENVPAIVGFGVAADLARRDMAKRTAHFLPLQERLITGLQELEGVRLTGHPVNRLPHQVSCVADHVEGESVLLSLIMNSNLYAASGTACSGKAEAHSHVLKAIGIGAETRSGSLVFGLGLDTTIAEIDYLLGELPKTITRLRSLSPLI